MELIIGGAFQGKKEYAKAHCKIDTSQMILGESADYEDIFSCKCVCHFHEWVKRFLEETENYTAFAEELYRRNPEICIITNELGYGVVPLEAFDRRYREATGRICTELAKRSSKVTRVVLGQGQVIKHA